MTFNIVELIENNPVTKLSGTYQNKLLIKIKDNFTDYEQQMFVASFYCYLNYDTNKDFVIDLDNVWKWLGFNQKYNAKHMLEKKFLFNEDYIIIAPESSGATKTHTKGGHNKEIIMLTIRTFKLFCLKSGTKKAEKIHEYYVKLEESLQEIVYEETNELKIQLENKIVEAQLLQSQIHQHNEILLNTDKEKLIIREKTLLQQFPNNTQCVYYGIIDNITEDGERLIKFGNSNNLKNRVARHKDTYSNFHLINAFKVENKLQIENAIKNHTLFIQKQRTIRIKNKKYIELFHNCDDNDTTFRLLDKTIKEIITSIEYTPENYIKLLEQNKSLKLQLEQSKMENYKNEYLLLSTENKKLKMQNIQLLHKYNKSMYKTTTIYPITQKSIQTDNLTISSNSINQNTTHKTTPNNTQVVTQNNIQNYPIVMNELKKIYKKNSDGTYIIHGNLYQKLIGSRIDVWEKIAYKTSGGLIFDDLILNKNGKIISKKKSIQEILYNRFFIHGVNIHP